MNKRKRAMSELQKAREEYLSIRRINHEKMLQDLPEGEKKEKLAKLAEEMSVARPLTEEGMLEVRENIRSIEKEFQEKTGIGNPTDFKILQFAIALQLLKTLIVGVSNQKIGFLKNFDPDTRLNHNDLSIKKEERQAKDIFRQQFQDQENGPWLNTLYSSVPYDAIKGSKALGLSLNRKNHREKTLGTALR